MTMVFMTLLLTAFLICNRLLFFSAKMIMPMVKAKMNKESKPLPFKRNVDRNSEASVVLVSPISVMI